MLINVHMHMCLRVTARKTSLESNQLYIEDLNIVLSKNY
jgi:hypothetical protein